MLSITMQREVPKVIRAVAELSLRASIHVVDLDVLSLREPAKAHFQSNLPVERDV